MTEPSVIPSFVAFALMESTLGIRATYFHGAFVALNLCPFTRAHEDVPNLGAVIVTDPDVLDGDYLWCPACGRKTQQQVMGLLSGVTLSRASMGWDDFCRVVMAGGGGAGRGA